MKSYDETRRIRCFEAVEDDENVIGTFVSELGRGGKVNLNRRIYPAQEFRQVNEDLNERIQNGQVAPGEENHPSFFDGPSFNIPVILQSVEIVEEGPGVVRAEGKFAITNTRSGRDIKTLHELGVPVGVSSKMYARPEYIVIDRASEFFTANQEFEGEEVAIMRDLAFDETGPYDLVRVPSAGTFVQSQEALAVESRLVTEGVLKPIPEKKIPEPVAAEAAVPETEPVAEPAEGADMDLQEKIDALEAELTEIRAGAEQAAEEATTALEAEKTRANEAEAKLAEATEAAEEARKAVEKAEAVRETAEGDFATQLTELQAAHEATREELQALQAEREAARLGAALANAVAEASEGDHKDLVQAELASLVNEGILTDPEKVGAHAERVRALCEKAASVPEGARVTAGDDDKDTPEAPSAPVTAEALDAAFITHMNRIHTGVGQNTEN